MRSPEDLLGKVAVQRISIVLAVTALVMLLIFAAAQWYANNSSLPRYCNEPSAAIEHVRKILTTKNPVGEQSKRPYAVAAKLLFLIPRQDGETVQSYLERLDSRIKDACHVP